MTRKPKWTRTDDDVYFASVGYLTIEIFPPVRQFKSGYVLKARGGWWTIKVRGVLEHVVFRYRYHSLSDAKQAAKTIAETRLSTCINLLEAL